MTIEAELADGRVLEFPDGTDPAVIQSTVKRLLGAPTKAPETTLGGVASEVGKGLVRGAGGLGEMIGEGFARTNPVGRLAIEGMRSISAPSKSFVQPTPATEAERFAGTAAEITGGGIAGGGAGSVRAAATNVLAGLTGAAGEQVGGTAGRIAGTLLPSVPGLARAGKALLTKRAPENLRTFQEAGVTPSAGQATQNSFLQGLENLASKFPGGSGLMRRFTERQQAQLGASTRTGVSAEDAGRAIESGVSREGGFLQRFHATQERLYNRLDEHIPKHTMIDVRRTSNALADLNADIPGAPNISRFFKNEKIQGIEKALKADTETTAGVLSRGGGIERQLIENLPPAQRTALAVEFMDNQLPYEAVKKLRTLVGREITDATIASSVPKSKWKALYAALSDDLGAAAEKSGPEAVRTWKMATNYTSAGIARIENVLDRVIGKGKQPEDIFKAFNPTDPDQANKVRAVLRSLEPSERKVVTDAVVNRLGRASPGRQNEVGEIFSSETFLTNWNKLSQGAKAQLFPDAQMRSNVEAVAKAAATIREGSKVFQNTSGTAGSFAAYSVYASPIAAVATGSAAPIAAAAGAAGSAYVGAKMLTSPKIVEWLATPVRPSAPGAAAVHLARLGTIYNETKDAELRAEIERFVGSAAVEEGRP